MRIRPIEAASPTASASLASAARLLSEASARSQGRIRRPVCGAGGLLVHAPLTDSVSRAGVAAVPSTLAASKSWIGAPGITVLMACL